jgi:hypothetical protein
MSVVSRFAVVLLMLGLGACAIQSSQPGVSLPRSGSWVLLPLVNYSQAPQAGERAEQILYSVLARQGLTPAPYPRASSEELPLLDDGERLQQALQWARQRGASYAISGSVEEWQYKSGLDGEPAIGITLKVIEPASGQILWTASSARAGWSRESLAGAGQRVLEALVEELPLDPPLE